VGKCLRSEANVDTDFAKLGLATSTLAILSFLA
jgi:hypothetical protein